jgi:D-alanine-D-alanine ligase
LQEIAVAAHAALGCVDLSRADFIVTDAEDIVLLEVNSLPGMTPTSLYPDGARAQGLAFDALMDALVRSGLARGRRG